MHGFASLSSYRYLFCDDKEIAVGSFATIKPIAGESYGSFYLTVDLSGKTRSELVRVIEELRSIIEHFSEIRIEFIFNKKEAVYQISGLLDNLISYEDFFYFTTRYAANNRVFIGFGGTEITEFFKDREFLKNFLAMLLMTGKKGIYEKIEPELQRCNWECSDGYFFHTDGKIIKTKNVDVEKAKRFLLGMGDYALSYNGVLTMIEPARNGDIYIPSGVTKIVVDFLPASEWGCFKERKMIFNSEEEFFIGDEITFKPKKGKKYEFLPITVDLSEKSYEETLKLMRQLDRFGVTFQLHSKYIFNKEILAKQIKAILIPCLLLIGMGFSCCADEKPIATIGKNNVTKLFKNRDFTEKLLASLKKVDFDVYETIAVQLDVSGWRFSDGTEFKYTRG